MGSLLVCHALHCSSQCLISSTAPDEHSLLIRRSSCSNSHEKHEVYLSVTLWCSAYSSHYVTENTRDTNSEYLHSYILYNIIHIRTGYYTFSVPYCVYCSRPEGAKRPRASAVNKAIRHGGRVVSSLSPNNRLENVQYA